MTNDENERRSFSWLKAFGHSVAWLLAFLVPSLGFSIAGVVDARKAGEFSAGFMVVGLLVGWLWSFVRQRGRATSAAVWLFILIAMSAYQVFVLAAAAGSRMESMESLQAKPPVMLSSRSGGVLCQHDFGLKLPLAGVSVTLAPELATTLAEKNPNDAVARWVYRAGADIVVLLAARGFDSKKSLQNFMDGTRGTASNRNVQANGSLDWADGYGTILLSFDQGEPVRANMRCISNPDGKLACIQTISSASDPLAGLRQRLELSPCP